MFRPRRLLSRADKVIEYDAMPVGASDVRFQGVERASARALGNLLMTHSRRELSMLRQRICDRVPKRLTDV
jgi:hypothetical protein